MKEGPGIHHVAPGSLFLLGWPRRARHPMGSRSNKLVAGAETMFTIDPAQRAWSHDFLEGLKSEISVYYFGAYNIFSQCAEIPRSSPGDQS